MRVKITVNIEDLERELLAHIDREAEDVRGRFITNTPSQPSVYLQKEAEALALVANVDLPEGETPNLTREAVRTGENRIDVAAVILTQAHIWREISASIEDIRLGAKEAVRGANSHSTKRLAAQDIDWSDVLALAP